MTEEGHPERLNVQIEEWRPTGTEADQEFFNTIMPELRALKARHYDDLSKQKSYSEEYVGVRLDYLERRLHALKPGDVVYIGRSSDRVVACVLVRWDEQENRTKIEQFYTDSTMRSQGIGKNMLERAFAHARETHTGSRGLFLSTGKGEENRARKLYERNGFFVSALPGDNDEEDRFDLDFGTEQKSV